MARRLLLIYAASALLSSCTLFRSAENPGKKPPVLDAQAEEWMLQGKQALAGGSYSAALDAFERARNLPFHRSTTAAYYLAGLAAYKLGYDEIARQRFSALLSEYPRTRYAEEARYHLALARLRNREESAQAEGCADLAALLKETLDEGLARDAEDQLRAYAFQRASLGQIERLSAEAPASLRALYFEAQAYKLLQSGKRSEAEALHQTYLKQGGSETEYLGKLFPRRPDPASSTLSPEQQVLRVALFLPLYLDYPDIAYMSKIPVEMVLGLEFYEGFQLAAEEISARSGKKVYVRVFDSRRDTMLLRSQLQELDSLGVSLVIGDIYNSESRIISAWAEARKTPQVIPISATADLIQQKQYTFLAHPSAQVHGAALAQYAWHSLNVRHAYVFVDGQKASQELADGFFAAFQQLGGDLDTLRISPSYRESLKEIQRLVNRIPADNPETGVYIPLMNYEEAAGLIVNLLRARSKETVLMGSPHFRTRYTTLGRDLKDSYRMLFTSSHMHDPEDPAYQRLNERYLERYKIPATDNVVQGYDLGMFLLSTLSRYDPKSGLTADQYLRMLPVYKGIHLDYDFRNTQGNQSVNIGQYLPEGVRRVN
jgi:ABC-type branched-subunit amino acid transport system substrate-binding protein/TolA-binding protein